MQLSGVNCIIKNIRIAGLWLAKKRRLMNFFIFGVLFRYKKKGRCNLMGYIFLGLAILGELLGTNLLKASNGFSSLWETVGSLVSYGASFYFLALALKTINLNVAYALWAGLGIVLTTVLAVVVWKESINLSSVLGIVLILSGVVVLNLYGPGH